MSAIEPTAAAPLEAECDVRDILPIAQRIDVREGETWHLVDSEGHAHFYVLLTLHGIPAGFLTYYDGGERIARRFNGACERLAELRATVSEGLPIGERAGGNAHVVERLTGLVDNAVRNTLRILPAEDDGHQ